MKISVIEYVQNVTNTNCANLSWQQVVDDVILPKMAGPRDTRWCINDAFMELLAKYADEIVEKDSFLASILFEIALQRLSCGAVLHEPTSWPEPLPKKYWDYSSYYDEHHVMSEGCFIFLSSNKVLRACLSREMTRSHTLKILFGLVDNISEDGKVSSAYYALDKYKDMSYILYNQAKALIEEEAGDDEIYAHYARPNQWEKHIGWFKNCAKELDWKDFLKRIDKAQRGNFLKKWREERAVKKRIAHYVD